MKRTNNVLWNTVGPHFTGLAHFVQLMLTITLCAVLCCIFSLLCSNVVKVIPSTYGTLLYKDIFKDVVDFHVWASYFLTLFLTIMNFKCCELYSSF